MSTQSNFAVPVDLEPLFEPGAVAITQGFLDAIGHEDIATTIMVKCLLRHLRGDFGEICESDKKSNHRSIEERFGTIFSSYHINSAKGALKAYMITDADQTSTTLQLSSEY